MADLWRGWKQQGSEGAAAVVEALHGKSFGGRTFDLVELVGHLGAPLTSLDVQERSWACEFLASVLGQLGPAFPMQPSECSLLCIFFCDRLRDTPCVKQSLEGILSLASRDVCTNENAERILRAMFAELDAQSLPQDTRTRIFRVLTQLLTRHQPFLVASMGPDFVYGFLRMMDGEKDPRCLVLVFSLLPTVLRDFPIDRFVEELFDVTSCYFPISFRPPPNSTLGITREDLVLGLRRCLAATPRFAAMGLDLLLEKLGSSDPNAKEDSLLTLIECFPVYGIDGIAPLLSRLSAALRIEALHGSSAIQPHALAALTALSLAVTGSAQQSSELLDGLCGEVKRHIADHDGAIVVAHGRVAAALALGSPASCAHTLAVVVPALAADFGANDVPTHRAAVVAILIGLLLATRKHEGSTPGLAAPYMDACLGMFQAAATNATPDLAAAGLSGLSAFVSLAGLPNPILVVCARTVAAVLAESSDAKVLKEAVAAARALGVANTLVLLNQLITPLVALIEQGTRPVELFRCLADMCPNAMAATALVLFCLRQMQGPHATSAAQCLKGVVDNCGLDAHGAKEMLDASFASVLALVCVVDNPLSNDVAAPLLIAFRTIFALVAAEVQTLHFAALAQAMAMTEDEKSLPSKPTVAQLLYLHFLAVLHRSLVPALPLRAGLYDVLVQVAALPSEPVSASPEASMLPQPASKLPAALLYAPTDLVSNARWTLASLVNKHADTPAVGAFLESMQLRLDQVVHDGPTTAAEAGVALFGTLTSGLVARSHVLGLAWARHLASLLAVASAASTAAESICALMVPTPLTAAAHCLVSPLFRQRLFLELVPLVVLQYKSGDAATKDACMVAIDGLVARVPQQVLLDELPSVLPLLLESLASSGVSAATLSTFAFLLGHAGDVVGQHLATLVPRLLSLTQHQTMAVRMAALDTLAQLANLPTHKVFPFARTVVRHLAAALDDRKRLVRARAVACRSKWFTICAPSH